MGGKSSKGLDEAQQRRLLQVQTIQHGLSRSNKPVHFDNLVFEGSGNRAVSYFGTVKVLEELGLLASFRRYAGVGAGAAWALLLSIGLTPGEIADLQLDKELSYHAKYIHMSSVLPSLAQKFGWSPLGRAIKIARKVLEQRTGKQETTFREIYDTFGKELCIVATNLTTGSLEYFHPKTTPDIPVVDALIMSSTPPGIMKPRYILRGGKKHYFVDGGVLCNYPIYCYDGWYLSMRKEDSFLSRLQVGSIEPPFRGFNDKTLGCMLVTPGDRDFGEQEFIRRLQYEPIARPNTKLARAKGESAQTHTARVVGDGHQSAHAGQRLLEHLRLANINGDDTLNMEKFQRALGQGSTPEDIQLLFGLSPEQLTELFNELEKSRDTKVTFEEFVEIAMQNGNPLMKDKSATVRDIKTTPDMMMAVMSAIEGKSKQVYLKEIDIMRTVGINADYVSSVDTLEFQDKNFLVMQGEQACLAFLLEYIQNFASQEQLPIPQIYSALPNRISRAGSIIEEDEMQDYSVPSNLYPTLPPSYASAIGDSSHLRDTIETNWPTPGLYPAPGGCAEEKRPLVNYIPHSSGSRDTWGLPVAPVPNQPPCEGCTGRTMFQNQVHAAPRNDIVRAPQPAAQSYVVQVRPPTQSTVIQQQFQPKQVQPPSNPQQCVYPGVQVSTPGGSKQVLVQGNCPPGVQQQGQRMVLNGSPVNHHQRQQIVQITRQGSPLGSPQVQRHQLAGPKQGIIMINGRQAAVPSAGANVAQPGRQLQVRTADGRTHYIISQ